MDIRVKAVSAFGVNGDVIPVGGEVDVSKNVARDLLQRGKAVLAFAEDQADLAPALDELTDDALQDMAADYGIEGLPKKFSRAKWLEAIAAYEAAAAGDEDDGEGEGDSEEDDGEGEGDSDEDDGEGEGDSEEDDGEGEGDSDEDDGEGEGK
jgi:hypothetical protein